MSSNAANIPQAGLNCLAHGCIASTGPDPNERCKQSGCMAHEYTAKMPSREALAAAMKRQPAETDAQKVQRLAAGFAGDCNNLLDGVPEQVYVPARRPDGHTQMCDADSCVCGLMGSGFPGMSGDIAAKSPTMPPESHGERAGAEPGAEMARDFARWYYWQGDCTGDEYKRLADRIEERMLAVLGAEELGRLGKEAAKV